MTEHRDTKFDGKRAIISDKTHPHNGVIAECCGADRTIIGWGMKFRSIKTNEEFYVFNGGSVSWINDHQNNKP